MINVGSPIRTYCKLVRVCGNLSVIVQHIQKDSPLGLGSSNSMYWKKDAWPSGCSSGPTLPSRRVVPHQPNFLKGLNQQKISGFPSPATTVSWLLEISKSTKMWFRRLEISKMRSPRRHHLGDLSPLCYMGQEHLLIISLNRRSFHQLEVITLLNKVMSPAAWEPWCSYQM